MNLHERNKCNNLIHGVVSLIFCGLWIPVWIIAAWWASSNQWVCQSCGYNIPVRNEPDNFLRVCLWVVFIIAIAWLVSQNPETFRGGLENLKDLPRSIREMTKPQG